MAKAPYQNGSPDEDPSRYQAAARFCWKRTLGGRFNGVDHQEPEAPAPNLVAL